MTLLTAPTQRGGASVRTATLPGALRALGQALAMVLTLAPSAWAVVLLAGGHAVREFCAGRSCTPAELAPSGFVAWQNQTLAALSGPFERVWWLYATSLMIGALITAAAGWLAIGLAITLGGLRTRRWVAIMGALGLLALLGAFWLTTPQIAWVNLYLE
ncbi:hypothetical protein [Propioniciclava soli]|uniref:Uncharacterized protein n=1 Tax=Propioniciclava soli TaxID=2775081 RepID=A0ABZ3C341_9ACTN|nr:hypothetical protein [Propioniciclava soli]